MVSFINKQRMPTHPFKMAATDKLHLFCGRKKAEISPILQSHSPQYGDVQVLFFKTATMDELFLWV